jgi:hypothetical protein
MTKRNPHMLPPREWYRLNVWRKRSAAQLRAFPLCCECTSMMAIRGMKSV